MTDADLDTAYTALSHALGRVGEQRAPLLLAMLSLQLLSRLDSAEQALPLVANAEAQCADRPNDRPTDATQA